VIFELGYFNLKHPAGTVAKFIPEVSVCVNLAYVK